MSNLNYYHGTINGAMIIIYCLYIIHLSIQNIGDDKMNMNNMAIIPIWYLDRFNKLKYVKVPDKDHPKDMFVIYEISPECRNYDILEERLTEMSREEFEKYFMNNDKPHT